jgi:hypothetical protein
MDWITFICGVVLMISAMVTFRSANRYRKHVGKAVKSNTVIELEAQWEATAVAQDAIIEVHIKRGKQSILIGQTDIHREDFGKTVESLTATAEMRAMEMNSMGIKWDGDRGTMVPVDVADRYKEDRDKFQKQAVELQKSLENVLSPEGFASLVEMYLRKVSPTSEVGTIRVMNNGHPIAEISPDPGRPRLQGPPGWKYGSDSRPRPLHRP